MQAHCVGHRTSFSRRKQMGRPINKKFFGNLNTPPIGGEGVNTIAVANSGTLYAANSTIAVTFSAPQLVDGVAATGRVTTTANRNVATVTLLTAGSGYTSAPTATVNGGTTGTTATFTVSLTNTRDNAIAFTSYLSTGSSAVTGGDIDKQEASRRYTVTNSQGTGQVKLVTAEPLVAGTMFIVATDKNGSTYYVKKLTARRATLVRKTMSGSYEYATNQAAGWTLGTASTGTVSIASN